LNLSRSASR